MLGIQKEALLCWRRASSGIPETGFEHLSSPAPEFQAWAPPGPVMQRTGKVVEREARELLIGATLRISPVKLMG